MIGKMKKCMVMIFTLVVCLSSIIPTSVYADTTKFNKYAGHGYEDWQIENAYKIWSVFRTAGYSEYAAAGVIGNAVGESHLDPTTIETIYNEPNSVTGSRKSAAMSNWCAFTVGPMADSYIKSGWGVKAASDGDGHSHEYVAPVGDKMHINLQAYVSSQDNKFYPGLGFFGYTGYEASRLINVAKENKLNWYDTDANILNIFIQKWKSPNNWTDKCKIENEHTIGSSKDKRLIMQAMYNTKFTGTDQATILWMEGYEGASYTEASISARKRAAAYFYTLFHGDFGDFAYGVKILTMAGFPVASADRKIHDVSIMAEFMQPNIIYPSNNGFAFDVDNNADEYANEAATALLMSLKDYSATGSTDGSDTKKYSLYDLFGSDIYWYRYLGERTVPISLLDHIYSGVTQDKADLLIDLGETVFYQSSTYLSCQVYSNRPKVLTQDEVHQGKIDPRVTISTTGMFTGFSYTSGSFAMACSKAIVSLVSLGMSDQPVTAAKDIAEKITGSTIWDNVARPLVMILIGFAMCLFVVSLVGEVRKYAVGQSSFRQVLGRFGMGVLCLGICFTLAYSPGRFIGITAKSATIIDDLFNSVLTLSYSKDDVIGSTDGTKTTEAALWKTAIFEPWCIGQFGDRYENLYTQFSEKPDKNKMEQSKATEEEISALAGDQWTFSSADYTGDVAVPVGQNKFIRNWAAYLYSCGSKYHIDQAYLDGSKPIPENANSVSWPNYYSTAYKSSVAADTFRVIDAQLNISPQIYKSGATLNNYSDSHMINNKFGSQGSLMLVYSIILLLSFGPAILMKIYFLLKLFFALVQTVLAGILELCKPSGTLSDNFSNIWTNAVNLFINCLRLYVLTILFTTLVGKSFVQTIVFLILAIMVYSFNLDKARTIASDVRVKLQHAKYLFD